MKILLCGQKNFGRDVLGLVAQLGHEIVAVVCPVKDQRDKLHIEAMNRELPVIPAGTLTADVMPEGVDLIVAAHSHDFIGRKTRDKTTYGALGYHPSLLPLHRGRDAIKWAIKMREQITGGTVFWLTDTVDAGPIAAQDWCFIRPGDNALELWKRDLAPMGVRLFETVLKEIASGVAVRIPPVAEVESWEPGLDGAPRLRRPDLTRIGDNGLRFVTEKHAEKKS